MRDEFGGDIVTPEWLARHGVVIAGGEIGKDGKRTPRQVVNPGTADLTINPATNTINSAKEADLSLLGWMVTRGILDEAHSYYAMVFTDLRRCFRRIVDYRGNSIYALEFFGGPSQSILETLYLRVCRLLRPHQEHMIHRAMLSTAVPAARTQAWDDRARYRDAFDALVTAIDTVREAE